MGCGINFDEYDSEYYSFDLLGIVALHLIFGLVLVIVINSPYMLSFSSNFSST